MTLEAEVGQRVVAVIFLKSFSQSFSRRRLRFNRVNKRGVAENIVLPGRVVIGQLLIRRSACLTSPRRSSVAVAAGLSASNVAVFER